MLSYKGQKFPLSDNYSNLTIKY